MVPNRKTPSKKLSISQMWWEIPRNCIKIPRKHTSEFSD